MATTIRPEVSKKSKYWIERHRYYELKHFCLQYPIWRKAYHALDSLSKQPVDCPLISSNEHGDPTAQCVAARSYYLGNMEMIEQTAIATDAELGDYILIGVTEGVPYDILRARYNVPCNKDTYYDLYRKFFWLLNKRRC